MSTETIQALETILTNFMDEMIYDVHKPVTKYGLDLKRKNML